MAVFISGKATAQLVVKDNFSDNSWGNIVRACQMNEVPDTWMVGDSKTMTIDGVEYQITIIGKNHDIYSDGTGVAPLTFQMHDCYGTKYRMNSTDTNSGGWKDSQMRTTHLPSILTLMPNAVQTAIRNVNKLTAVGNNTSTIVTTADKLFLLSEREVLGKNTYSYTGEGTQYEYYTKGNSAVKTASEVAVDYWLRSPVKGTSASYSMIAIGGSFSYFEASSSEYISPAFCF